MTWKPFSSEREYDGFLRINSCGKRELRDRDYDGFLRINSCGKRELRDRDYDTFRPDGRIDYSLQYIREGVCEVEFGGEMQPVEAGCLILYFPQTPQHYLFREGERSMLLWSHFSGTACGMLEPLRAAQAVVVKVRDRQEFERNFDKLLMAHYHTEPYGEQLEQSYMMVLLSLILKSRSAEEEKLQRIHVGMLLRVIGALPDLLCVQIIAYVKHGLCGQGRKALFAGLQLFLTDDGHGFVCPVQPLDIGFTQHGRPPFA